MYKKVDALNFTNEENEVLKFWRKNNVKALCMKHNEGKPRFNFYEGPPTANGVPHSGHVLTRALKDVFTRYKSMKGYFVPRKGGWDTHGLPVELSVEKELGISGKQQIEEYGIEKFIKKCKDNVWKYVDLWREFSERVGYFVNMEDDYYVTYYNDYIESVWWALSEMNKKGLLYKGYKILPSCPRCGTALSSHELAQGYEDRNDTTCVAKFKSADQEDLFYLAWTTTPWTLPSNIALCVNANEDYVKIKTNNEHYILAKALLNNHFKPENYVLEDTFKGKTLEFKKYVPLFNFVGEKDKQKGYYITCDDYVTLTDGTGIVHIAPAFGEDDAAVGRKYGLPFIQLVDKYGKFVSGCGKYSGRDVFKTNDEIADDLAEQNKILKIEKHVHSYPHCWRCHSPLIYFARSSWFVKTTELRKNMVKNNNSVNWLPETVKNGRMGNFLENNIDWCLSRDRYWGTPLPVWMCEKCGHYHVVGSIAELKKLGNITGDIELHKPYVDEITFTCEKCGGTMKRELEVIDCWFDSGSMPFAQHHYPFENKELFKESFPAQFISEGIDQTRGWFYALQAISTALFNKSPYETCIANGMVVDEKGRKLSKSLGNYVPPMEMLSSMGADPVRWTFYTGAQPWNNLILTKDTVAESQKKYFGTLWNTYAFYVLYAEIDKFDPSKYSLADCKLSVMDKWILSEFNKLTKLVTTELDNFHVTESSRAMETFVDNLSNWYIRTGRKRYWGSEFTEDKKAAYVTLYTVLSEFAKLSAPFTPFMSETIYGNIVKPFFKDAPISVHLCDYPVVNEALIDEQLSEEMNLTYAYTELGRAARNLSGIKNRQPLSRLYLTEANNKTTLTEGFIKILKEELNVKEVVQHENLANFVTYSLKPQLKTLGPKYGKLLNGIREFLLNANANEIVNTVENGKVFKTKINGEEVEFSKDDLLIAVNQKEGFASATNEGLAVVLDTHLTTELVEEGIVREFVSKVQNLRKTSNFVVTDRIKIEISGNPELEQIILKYENQIRGDVLALDVKLGKNGTHSEEFDFNDKKLKAYISKAK